MRKLLAICCAVGGLLLVGGCWEVAGRLAGEAAIDIWKPWKIEFGGGISAKTDKVICNGVKYGNPDYIEEAARRGLTDKDCE